MTTLGQPTRDGLAHHCPVEDLDYEALANECYWMEPKNVPGQYVWAHRKAAWAIEDTEQDLGLIYQAMGVGSLEGIENVGPCLAEVIEELLRYRGSPQPWQSLCCAVCSDGP